MFDKESDSTSLEADTLEWLFKVDGEGDNGSSLFYDIEIGG